MEKTENLRKNTRNRGKGRKINGLWTAQKNQHFLKIPKAFAKA